MSAPLKIVLTALCYLFTIAGGIWLTHTGRPLNTLLFSAHKLIALASVVFTAILCIGLLRTADTRGVLMTLVIAIGILAAALIATGVMMSFDKPFPSFIRYVHIAATVLIVAATALYVIKGNNQ